MLNSVIKCGTVAAVLTFGFGWQYASGQNPPATKKRSPRMSEYLLLSDGTTHQGKPPKDEFYVRGRIVAAHQFEPTSGVEGHGTVCDNMSDTPGYRVLRTGDFEPMQAGHSIPYPVVEGCKRGNKFLPKKGEQPAVVWGEE